MGISQAEAERRRRSVDRARHSTEMEGGRSTAEDRAVQEAYVRGELTLDEYVTIATTPPERG